MTNSWAKALLLLLLPLAASAAGRSAKNAPKTGTPAVPGRVIKAPVLPASLALPPAAVPPAAVSKPAEARKALAAIEQLKAAQTGAAPARAAAKVIDGAKDAPTSAEAVPAPAAAAAAATKKAKPGRPKKTVFKSITFRGQKTVETELRRLMKLLETGKVKPDEIQLRVHYEAAEPPTERAKLEAAPMLKAGGNLQWYTGSLHSVKTTKAEGRLYFTMIVRERLSLDGGEPRPTSFKPERVIEMIRDNGMEGTGPKYIHKADRPKSD